MTVEVPDIAGAYRSRMKVADLSSPEELRLFEQARAGLEAAGIAFDSGYRAVRATMAPPGVDDTLPDDERLARAERRRLVVPSARPSLRQQVCPLCVRRKGKRPLLLTIARQVPSSWREASL